MGSECAYSFWDLYKEANGKEATPHFRQKFFKMSQEQRNKFIKKWSKKAGWGTEERIGTDGKIYTAFSKSWSREKV